MSILLLVLTIIGIGAAVFILIEPLLPSKYYPYLLQFEVIPISEESCFIVMIKGVIVGKPEEEFEYCIRVTYGDLNQKDDPAEGVDFEHFRYTKSGAEALIDQLKERYESMIRYKALK